MPAGKNGLAKIGSGLICFFRSLKLKLWFGENKVNMVGELLKKSELCLKEYGLYNKSDLYPPITSHGIDMFTTLVNRDVDKP